MKILWTSGTSKDYYQTVSSKTLPTWNYLKGNKLLYLDDVFDIIEIETKITDFSKWQAPVKLSSAERKFYRKSRSILSALENTNYDYIIWIDGDVEILQEPNLSEILPTNDDLMSVVKKPGKDGTGTDTGFIAFNTNHKNISYFIEEYSNYWISDKLNSLPFRYDACVLEKIVEKYQWKNLFVELKGKPHCGFEGTLLEPYFTHHWGKKGKIFL